MSDTKLETLVGIIDTVDVPLKGIISEQGNVGGILSNVSLRGYSAYEVAKLCGYNGTEEEWLESLIGPEGESPTVEINEIPNGYEMTITAINGTHTFTVFKGEKGVYIGSDEMPEGYCIQIDPEGDLDGILQDMLQSMVNKKFLDLKTELNTDLDTIKEYIDNTYISLDSKLDDDELDATLKLIF